ncbi:MAG: hypothetical protein IKE43_05845 [Coriobacteriales bacterium]|nr:hypothetical protein [Coriobacteriales bacterium]
MDLSLYSNLSSPDEYEVLQTELLGDLQRRLSLKGFKYLRTLQKEFCFASVIATAENDRFLFIAIDRVDQNPDWAEKVRLRRMSSERDWKGEEFHYCTWDEVDTLAAELLTEKYDNEIL